MSKSEKPNKFSFRLATRQRQERVIKVSNWLNWKEDKGEGKRGNDVGEQAGEVRRQHKVENRNEMDEFDSLFSDLQRERKCSVAFERPRVMCLNQR
jgi:hypothetical protein